MYSPTIRGTLKLGPMRPFTSRSSDFTELNPLTRRYYYTGVSGVTSVPSRAYRTGITIQYR